MLTDIFAARYAQVPLWNAFNEAERRLLVQAFRIVSEQLWPFRDQAGQELHGMVRIWTSIHDRLSMELGLQELSPRGVWREHNFGGNRNYQWQASSIDAVCRNFVLAQYQGVPPPDQFIKERLSFVEIAFREREQTIAAANANLQAAIAAAEAAQAKLDAIQAIRLPSRANALRESNARVNQEFRESVDELNARFRQAGARLNYHNGYIQLIEDARIEEQVESSFWRLVSDPKWVNVDTDIKEAIDRRDGGGRDPALYAAKALESTIKIISGDKGWTRGNERGAANYIDNLASRENGQFITPWEQEAMKAFFSKVRNELGHGPGGAPMPELTSQQTSWAIESCMCWIKSLILRI